VFARLAELDVAPELAVAGVSAAANNEIVERVIRRAQALRASWHSNGGNAATNGFGKTTR